MSHIISLSIERASQVVESVNTVWITLAVELQPTRAGRQVRVASRVGCRLGSERGARGASIKVKAHERRSRYESATGARAPLSPEGHHRWRAGAAASATAAAAATTTTTAAIATREKQKHAISNF